ncbi:Protein transport protein [Venturia nashicola]|nr:Protein transport protein [Venturia nashicola]
MLFSSYLLPTTLLAMLPAMVSARGCTHYEVTYIVPCPDDKCKGGAIEDYEYAFRTNANEFETWADKAGVGGYCGGFCQDVQRRTWGKIGQTAKDGAGYTFTMRCVAARMGKIWSEGIPAYREGLERIMENRACDVSCSPSGAPFSGQNCEFLYGDC